jgi:hypothetical protein
MSRVSPTAEGFRLIFRKPTIPLAEIAWRWSFAAAAWFLIAAFLLEYGDSLGVTPLDRLLLGTRQPILAWRAIRHIFQGSAFRFSEGGIVLAIALTIAWIVLASLGRVVTVRSLIEENGFEAPHRWAAMWSLLELNFLRAAAALATITAGAGSLLFASSLWASTHVSIGDAIRFSLLLLFVTAAAWSALNWLLSTSAVFAVDGGQGAFEAIASAVRFCLKRPGALAAAGTWFGLAHFGAFVFACGAGFTVLGATGVIGVGPVLFLECLIVLAYSGVVDFLHMGRLAAYLVVIRGREDEVSPQPRTEPADGPQAGAIDPGELILSDVPLPAS